MIKDTCDPGSIKARSGKCWPELLITFTQAVASTTGFDIGVDMSAIFDESDIKDCV